ncbi:unnamed protein product, partial [Toxocara canis]
MGHLCGFPSCSNATEMKPMSMYRIDRKNKKVIVRMNLFCYVANIKKMQLWYDIIDNMAVGQLVHARRLGAKVEGVRGGGGGGGG